MDFTNIKYICDIYSSTVRTVSSQMVRESEMLSIVLQPLKLQFTDLY